MINNFGELLQFIRENILYKEREEFEADDLTIDIYSEEICFQINPLHDGMQYIYRLEENEVVCEVPLERDTGAHPIDAEEAVQIGLMTAFLENNKHILANFLKS